MEQPKEEANKPKTVVEAAGALYQVTPNMISDYKQLVKHTGGLLTASMTVAYQKGLSDAFRFLMNFNNEVKNVSEKQD